MSTGSHLRLRRAGLERRLDLDFYSNGSDETCNARNQCTGESGGLSRKLEIHPAFLVQLARGFQIKIG
jgi:hypothetical protein